MPIQQKSANFCNYESLHALGVCYDLEKHEIYTRGHYAMLCAAIVACEVFIASNDIFLEHMRQEIGNTAPK